MNFGSITGYHFQFEHGGKLHPAQISHEALQDCFGGVGRAAADVFAENAGAIRHKAIQIHLRNERRSPFLLTTRDFQ